MNKVDCVELGHYSVGFMNQASHAVWHDNIIFVEKHEECVISSYVYSVFIITTITILQALTLSVKDPHFTQAHHRSSVIRASDLITQSVVGSYPIWNSNNIIG